MEPSLEKNYKVKPISKPEMLLLDGACGHFHPWPPVADSSHLSSNIPLYSSAVLKGLLSPRPPSHTFPHLHSGENMCTRASRVPLTPTHRLAKPKLGPREAPDHSVGKGAFNLEIKKKERKSCTSVTCCLALKRGRPF